jgi:hypothetical protein
MTTHDLKTWPAPFAAVLSGAKTHEIRRSDRKFAVGDRLLLREWVPHDGDMRHYACPHVGRYTGRSILVEVTYLSAGGTWGLPSDLCVMSIRKVPADVAARVEERLR